jgi:hypothetical protein
LGVKAESGLSLFLGLHQDTVTGLEHCWMLLLLLLGVVVGIVVSSGEWIKGGTR